MCKLEEIYLAGGCLWGVQEFFKYIPGVIDTQAGRANGTAKETGGPYDGYSECVKVNFDPTMLPVSQLIDHLFEIIDPYSVNQQGQDIGPKYRTGIYSKQPSHLVQARQYLSARADAHQIQVEVLPLVNYVKSDDEHQHHLSEHPHDHVLCHLPWSLLHKYKINP